MFSLPRPHCRDWRERPTSLGKQSQTDARTMDNVIRGDEWTAPLRSVHATLAFAIQPLYRPKCDLKATLKAQPSSILVDEDDIQLSTISEMLHSLYRIHQITSRFQRTQCKDSPQLGSGCLSGQRLRQSSPFLRQSSGDRQFGRNWGSWSVKMMSLQNRTAQQKGWGGALTGRPRPLLKSILGHCSEWRREDRWKLNITMDGERERDSLTGDGFLVNCGWIMASKMEEEEASRVSFLLGSDFGAAFKNGGNFREDKDDRSRSWSI